MTDEPTKYRRAIGRWRCATIVLVFVCIFSIVIMAVFIALYHKVLAKAMMMQAAMSQTGGSCQGITDDIHLQENDDNTSPFRDLTRKEINALQEYLYRQPTLNLVKPSDIAINVSYLYVAELLPPNKEKTLQYLDRGLPKPAREAKVVIFRGDKPVPVIEEYAVGPLPNPTGHRELTARNKLHPIPFIYRPVTTPEYVGVIAMLTDKVDSLAGDLVQESYGARFKNCGDKCLQFRYITPMSTGTLGEMSRKMWFWTCQFVEFYTLHPLDLSIMVILNGKDISQYTVEKVYYSGHLFDSIESLVESYSQNTTKKTKISFPEVNKNLFSTLNQRGTPFPDKPLRPPTQFEPSGKRYSIHDRHVNYMNWHFDFRMSTVSGPQLFNIRYGKERIAYELSLQEISVLYSGSNPTQRYADFVDSAALIGPQAKVLVPGIDCPEHATFVSTTHVLEASEEPSEYPKSICIFELNTGLPLRRHSSFSAFHGHFFEGMVDVVLVVRTVTTVVNYDYILDFVFHQNGALEVNAISTGYILAAFYSKEESDYGFRLHDNLNGNLHHHIFNFKVDLDIKGVSNRFETLNLLPSRVSNSDYSHTVPYYHQTRFTRNLKKTEKDATYKYNFDAPKYLVFYNQKNQTKYGYPRSYRLAGSGFSKQLFPEGKGNEPSVTWARYQVAVTRRKDDEETSSSLYAMWDAKDPVIQFQKYIDDNDAIVDVDLVAWVTLGIHHIPHTEDLPVTPTVGLKLKFYLLPYNYFDEDPSMGSRNAVRIDPKDKNDPSKGVTINRYGIDKAPVCAPRPSTYDKELEKKPSVVLESGSGGSTAI